MMISRRALIAAGGGLVLTPSKPEAASPLDGAYSAGAERTIFATGGLFPGPPGNPLFAEFLLSLKTTPRPRICYIDAAGGDCAEDYDGFRRDMAALPCLTEHFDIFRPPTLDFADYLEGMDIVFVDGGSTRNLIALWKAWGFDGALAKAWKSGVVMSGSSAGALCWFEAGLSDSYPKVLSAVHCLGLLPGSADVHHHSRPDRATRFRRLIADGSLKSPGLALDEAVAVLYRGEKRIELVSAKKDAGAWLVTRTPSGYDEVSLPVRYLGPGLTTYKQRRQSVPVNR